MDGYPYSYASFKTRLHRWIRGDFQIYRWIKKYVIDKKEIKKRNPLNFLSKYKIFDNLIRAIHPISIMLLLIITVAINFITSIINTTGNETRTVGGAVIGDTSGVWALITTISLLISLISIMMPTIIDILNKIIFRKEGNKYQKNFEPTINSFVASLLRGIIALAVLPDKAYMSLDAMVRSIYRIKISNKHLLEWTTSEDAEKLSKNDLKSYYKNMLANIIFGILIILASGKNILLISIGALWLIAPTFMWYISRKEKQKEKIEELNEQEKEYLTECGKLLFRL